MKKNIVVERIRGTDIEHQKVEIVERKGLGHPDFIADSIAEMYSRNLSKYYLDHYGRILHHNVDKLEIIGGKTAPEFGGGTVIHPISVLFSGRATDVYGDERLPIRDIAVNSADRWIKENMRFVDRNSIRYLFETKSGSANLTGNYTRLGVFSNDTSFGTAFAPLSTTEDLVLELENDINGWELKDEFPFSGEDVKILAVRSGSRIGITIANAFVDKYLESVKDYMDKKQKLLDELIERTRFMIPSGFTYDVSLNAIDNSEFGKDGCYLTVTGTSAEHGDDGAVGRGNRVNGLITPNRVMSFEAVSGKNPVNHIGKIYNVVANRMANDIYQSTRKAISIKIVGKIGTPIDEPEVLVISTYQTLNPDDRRLMTSIAEEHLSRIGELTNKIVEGKIQLC